MPIERASHVAEHAQKGEHAKLGGHAKTPKKLKKLRTIRVALQSTQRADTPQNQDRHPCCNKVALRASAQSQLHPFEVQPLIMKNIYFRASLLTRLPRP